MSQLPHGWTRSRLGDVCDILDSRRVPVNAREREQRQGNVPYYGATGQVGWIDDHLFDEELVLLGEDGAPFLDPAKPKAYAIRGKSWVNNHAHVLRARDGVLSPFLLYQLNAIDYHEFVTGTTRLKLPQGPMRSIPLVLPPLAEQRRIVAALEEHLSDLDAAVGGLERARSNVLRLREASIDAAVRAAIDDTATEQRTLSALSRASGYGTSQKCAHDAPGPVVVRIPNIVDGSLDLIDIKRATDPESLKVDDSLAVGDLLIIRTNGSKSLIGRGAVIRETPTEKTFFASYLIRYRLVEDPAVCRWLAAIWHSSLVRSWVEAQAASSAGQYNLSVSKLDTLTLPIPTQELATQLADQVEQCLDMANRLTAELDTQLARASRLRQSVLKRAFEGKLVPQDPHDEPANALLARPTNAPEVITIPHARGSRRRTTTLRGRD